MYWHGASSMMHALLCTGLLAALLAPIQADHSAYADLQQYVVAHGGMVNLSIGTNQQGIRGIFASVDVKAGQQLAVIPSSVMLNCGDMNSSVAQPTLAVLRELKDPHSRHKPYLQVLPAPDQVLNTCNLPQRYWHLLESSYWEQHVRETQEYLAGMLSGQVNTELEVTLHEAVGAAPITLDELQYACALASTRVLVAEQRRRLMMIPVFDMANYQHDCPHDITPLDGNDQVALIAGRDMKAGDEYCFQYLEVLHDDYAVLSYGFLPAVLDPPRLLQIDHHLFDPAGDNYDLPDHRFKGNTTKVAAELHRQRTTLNQLLHNDKVATAGPEPGTDPIYDLLIRLQHRRRHALKYEILRLEQLLTPPAGPDGHREL